MTRLVDWAAEVLNASTNQPRLPHAIIVINASDSRTRPEQWDVDYATTSLLESVSQSIPSEKEAERVTKLLKHWHLPQRPVRNVRDLLLCYYSSVRVVHISGNDQYLKMEAQIEKLHSEIQSACEASMLAKKTARMLMNADELDELFQAAFEHFSYSLDSPFDLIKAARKNIPIPRDFPGNVTKVAVTIRDTLQKDGKKIRANDIFEPLSLMVASCIFLECSRGNWKGKNTSIPSSDPVIPNIKAFQAPLLSSLTATSKMPVRMLFRISVNSFGHANLKLMDYVVKGAASTPSSGTRKAIS